MMLIKLQGLRMNGCRYLCSSSSKTLELTAKKKKLEFRRTAKF